MRTRTISSSSQSSYIDIPATRGCRVRNESTQSRCAITEPAILHAGEIIQLSEEDGSLFDIDRPKRAVWQLVLLNAVVLGIEFCYAVETALVTPLLLQMGLPESLYSLTWIVSPILGFFLNPVVGSVSDRCSCSWGRRRPFILALCIGIIVGFTLFLNGEDIGVLAGDIITNHTVGLIMMIIGVIILDFCIDSCDSPSKAYIIDVCNMQDVERGLNIRAMLGGIGSGAGFVFNSIDWESNALGQALGNQSRVVFLFTFIICVICFTLTLFSVKEKPLVSVTDNQPVPSTPRKIYRGLEGGVPKSSPRKESSYDSWIQTNELDPSIISPSLDGTQSSRNMTFSGSNGMSSNHHSVSSSQNQSRESETNEEPITVTKLLVSVMKMPQELRWLCLNQFLSWSGLLAIFLFYTDYVGEVVYKGDPTAPEGSENRRLYKAGVKKGTWGMVIFSASVIVSAVLFDKLSTYITSRTAYVWGQTMFAVGTGCMAILSDSTYATLALNVTSGVMFVTITTLPYGLVAEYHQSYRTMLDRERSQRGVGTDLACLTSVCFLAQIVVSAILGLIVTAVGSKIAIVFFASTLAFLAALNSAFFVVYEVKQRDRGLNDEHLPMIT